MKPIEWEEGYTSYFNDGSLNDNPYLNTDRTNEFYLWIEGFINARKEHIINLRKA